MARVILVGCGFMGRMHANVYRLLKNAEVVAVVDRIAAKAEAFGREFGVPGYGDLASALAAQDADAVDICVPTDLHKQLTLEAAAAGKHVFCEKPMALTVADADAMIEACRTAGVRLMIGHCIRFWPEYAYLKKVVDDRSLGKLLSINLTRFGEFPSWSQDNWLADEKRAGGGALDMHIHDTDFALYLLGSPHEMCSFGSVDERGVGQIFTTMRKGTAIAHLEGGWNLPPKTPFKMAFRAIFERGTIFMDGGPLTVIENGREPMHPEFTKMSADGGGNISDLGGYYVELNEFIECLTENRDFRICTPESSRESLRVALEEISQVKARVQ